MIDLIERFIFYNLETGLTGKECNELLDAMKALKDPTKAKRAEYSVQLIRDLFYSNQVIGDYLDPINEEKLRHLFMDNFYMS